MLLTALYDFAHSRNILNDLAFSEKPIRWVIDLDSQQTINNLGIQETTGKKNRGKDYLAPQTNRPKVAGGVAEFLADNITALFGVDSDPEKDKDNLKKRQARDKNNVAKYQDFWQQIQQAFDKTQHPPLKILLEFHLQVQNNPSFLRWGVSQEAKDNEKPSWWLNTSLGNETKLGADNFTFAVDGKLLIHDESVIKSYWRKIYTQEIKISETEVQKGICLITGKPDMPISVTHNPKIKGVPDTQSFGAAIVSFDKDAFSSYGFKQSNNAPSSTVAVSAYCNALNFLLNNDSHHLRIGKTSVCFWAKDNKKASSFFSQMLNKPDPKSVADFLKSPFIGIDQTLAKKDQFYSVTLSGNAGRIVVRHWMQISLEEARKNLQHWFEDLNIISYGNTDNFKNKNEEKMPPLALFRLACATVRDAKELQVDILNQLYRASLENTAPSLMLVKPIVHRFSADLIKYGQKTLYNLPRFALLRLILNRNRIEGKDPMIKPQVFETNDRAYNCGRLLAIFDDLQRQAHNYKLEGAGVVERYYGSASSAPNSAFGILWRLHQHHLKKISRNGEKGKRAAYAIEHRIEDIASLFPQPAPNLPPQFPRTFNLQEQGRFALGFYQQKAARRAIIDEYRRKKKAGELKQNEQDETLELQLETGEQ